MLTVIVKLIIYEYMENHLKFCVKKDKKLLIIERKNEMD